MGLEPWYSDFPLTGFSRWVTAVFLGVSWAAGVGIGGVVVAIFACD